ncbi:MAG: hypothetical protein OEZ06_26000, partial [Myxococcales bacterium]|nr:hypothetical protein [Myxococcales bacterium]
KVRGMVESGRLQDDGKIGVRVGRVVNKHKVAKHFTLDIGDGHGRAAKDQKRPGEPAGSACCVGRSGWRR